MGLTLYRHSLSNADITFIVHAHRNIKYNKIEVNSTLPESLPRLLRSLWSLFRYLTFCRTFRNDFNGKTGKFSEAVKTGLLDVYTVQMAFSVGHVTELEAMRLRHTIFTSLSGPNFFTDRAKFERPKYVEIKNE